VTSPGEIRRASLPAPLIRTPGRPPQVRRLSCRTVAPPEPVKRLQSIRPRARSIRIRGIDPGITSQPHAGHGSRRRRRHSLSLEQRCASASAGPSRRTASRQTPRGLAHLTHQSAVRRSRTGAESGNQEAPPRARHLALSAERDGTELSDLAGGGPRSSRRGVNQPVNPSGGGASVGLLWAVPRIGSVDDLDFPWETVIAPSGRP